MADESKLRDMDVDTVNAKLDIERQMIKLRFQPVTSAKMELPALNLTIGQTHTLIAHLKKMVDGYEQMRPYMSYDGMQIVDEDY
jgi:hypothetical protein